MAVSLDKESAKAAGLPVLALLVVPAASARLLCSTLGRMMVCAPAFGAVTPRWGFIFPGLSTCPPAASSC
ncbi:metal ABC transporter permease [Rothia nasimurium]|uniref:metal ABC transporter permease n=1 Tax=Rothia nasimurium TaxID=85336 RepID=UPI00143060D9|nr:metal ABC transporter permease [Rothia nasimurium]MBF0808231.1 metal ABC transporter permease [Rothia nasimurium]